LHQLSDLPDWLRSLPRPAGVFCSNDVCCYWVRKYCMEAGLDVPGGVALVGVDNDESFCLLSNPPLSSVALPMEQAGYEAARILDTIMEGAHAPLNPVLLPPSGVVVRQSSDRAAVEDAALSRALSFIRKHAESPTLRVENVAKAANMSRRTLERRFHLVLGRSLMDEIVAERLRRAKDLLRYSAAPVSDVAANAGFGSPVSFNRTFQRSEGVPPGAWRKQWTLESAS
jgi:LacI family transcriptional regulator